jgi:hypothetical protein
MAKPLGTIVGATVGFFIGGPIGAIAGAGLGYAGGAVIEQVLNPGYDIPNVALQDSQSSAGILVNKQGTDHHIPVIYGVRWIGGTRVHITADSANNQFLYVKTVMCEGPIGGFLSDNLDDTPYSAPPLSPTPGATLYGPTPGTKYAFYTAKNKAGADVTVTPAIVAKVLGYPTTTSQLNPVVMGPGWTLDHKLEGLAYAAWRFQLYPANNADDASKNPFTNGIPSYTSQINGKVIKRIELCPFFTNDARTTLDPNGTYYQSTNGRSGYDPAFFTNDRYIINGVNTVTNAANRNPVSCLFDYLTNTTYGKGLPLSQIDLYSFKKEADRWYRDSNGVILTSVLQQHCDAVIDTSRTVFENVQNFLFNMNASLPYINGRFTLVVEDNRNTDGRTGGTATSVMTVNENNIIGSITIETENVNSKFNRVVVGYPGGEKNELVEVFYPAPGSAEEAQYLAEDNGRINELRLSYEHITSATIALQKARFACLKSRFRGKLINFIGDASLHQVTPGDIITFVYGPFGINAQFRVRTIQFNPDYTFSVAIEEHNETLYGPAVAVTPPRDIFRNTTISSQPIYIRNSDPQVVYVGDYTQANTSVPMTQLLGELNTNWQEYVTDNFDVATNSFTATQIAQGIQNGTITRWQNADIFLPTDELGVKPEIISSEYIINADNTSGNADILIRLKTNDNVNITDTKLMMYDYQQRAYKPVFIPESTTAAARGLITLKNYPLGIPIKYIVQYKSSNNTINSDEETINLAPYYQTNNINAEFLDTPLYSLDNGTQWNSTAIDSSTLQWSETGTWITGVPEATTHQTIVYTTEAVDFGERINAYPDTTVLFETNSTTPGNLKISYLVSEDDITYHEVPYDLMPLINPTFFSAFTDPPYSGFMDNNFETISSFSGFPRYYKTRVTLQQGEFYGVITKWRTDTITKTVSNQNMYSVLWIEDEDLFPDCDYARLYKRPVGSTRSEYALTASGLVDYVQDFVAVGGTPDLSAVSLFTGNLVASVIPDNNFKFSHITSLTGKTALEDDADPTPRVTMTSSAFSLAYTVGGGNVFLTFDETEDGNYYFGILPYMPKSPYETDELPFENGIVGDQSVYTFQTPWAISDENGHKIRLWVSETDQEIVFQDIDDDNNEIYTGPLKMNWTMTGYPLLTFDEEQGTIKPIEDV